MSLTASTTLDAVWSSLSQLMAWLLLGIFMFLAWKVRSWIVNVNWKCSVKTTLGCITQVVERLAEVRAKLDADRAYVFQFHNGNYFVNGSPILRMSCTHESVAPGVATIREHSQDIMINHVLEAVSFLSDYERGALPKILKTADLPECFYKTALASQGVGVSIHMPLYKDDRIVGMLGVSFHDEATPSKIDLRIVQNGTPQVEYLVNNSEKKRTFWQKVFGTAER